ncbi:aromatic ring-hydroxylating oxygenase subunit alpha [Sinomonas humi]|uniref:aromatic ring-hydroxylating oxygenase subunit alpha n=1 Tax=Sinomonas humi TaxID=1338436 RepID=UPI000691BA69|nr:SRPBCC family protein [Sinomonas humi]
MTITQNCTPTTFQPRVRRIDEAKRASAVEALARTLEARTPLTPEFYTDEGIFDLEMELIFHREWHYVGHIDRIPNTGDYFTTRVGRIPVLIVRGRDGKINAFVNVCRHRGHEVAQGEGNERTLQCHFHAWTWTLDGELRGAPRYDPEANFDKANFPLFRGTVETFGPFIFVNFGQDPEPFTSSPAFSEIDEKSKSFNHDFGAFELKNRWQHEIKANWKLILDISVECYHCASVHPEFASSYETGENYRVDLFQDWQLHISPPKGQLDDMVNANFIYHIWPHTQFFIQGPIMNVVRNIPVSTTTTLKEIQSFALPGTSDEVLAAREKSMDLALTQDYDAGESVQSTMPAGYFGGAPLLKDKEAGLIWAQECMYRAFSGKPWHGTASTP